MNLGIILKSEIKKQGKKQKDIAKLIGISNNAMCQICKGNTFPHKKTLHKICKVLNIKIEFIVRY